MARIGDTVRPELMRADTSGILRGSAAGAAALGQGLAGGMQSLATGIRKGKEAKGEIAGGRKFAKAMLDMHGEASDIGKQMLPLIEFFDNPEVRQSEKLGAVKYMTPIVGALTRKGAEDVATLERGALQAARNLDAGYRALEYTLGERKTTVEERKADVAEDLAEAAKTEALAKLVGAGRKQTVAEEALERESAKGMAKWFAGGDKKAQLHVDDLENVLDMFGDPSVPKHEDRVKKSGGMIKTGKMEGLAQNRIVGAIFAGEKAKQTRAAKERVYKSIIGTLRETLGAQFTENEAKRILGLYWDDLTTEEINYTKVQELKVFLQTQIDAKKAQAKSFRETGSFGTGVGGTGVGGTGEGGTGEGGTGEGGTGAGGATSRLGGLRARSEGTGDTGSLERTATVTGPGADEFKHLLFSANFSAEDLAKFRTGSNAQMGALLTDLRRRGRAAPEVGQGLSAEDKLRLMEQFVNPSEEEQQAIRDRRDERVRAMEARRAGGVPPRDPNDPPPVTHPVIPPIPGLLPPRPAADPNDPPPAPQPKAVDLRVSRQVPTGPQGRTPEWFKGGTAGQADLYKRLKDRPGVPSTFEEFLRLPDAEKIGMRDDYIASAPRAEIVEEAPLTGKVSYRITGTDPVTPRIPQELKTNVQILTTHRDHPASRQALKGVKHVVSLDFNDAKRKSARGIEIALPKKATAAQTASAKKFVRLASQFFKEAGVANPIRDGRGLPEGKNIDGLVYKFSNKRMMYTEPFFASHPEARKAIEKNPKKYAQLLVEAFGTLPGVTFLPPHSTRDKGATSGGVSEQAWAKKWIIPYLQELTKT